MRCGEVPTSVVLHIPSGFSWFVTSISKALKSSFIVSFCCRTSQLLNFFNSGCRFSTRLPSPPFAPTLCWFRFCCGARSCCRPRLCRLHPVLALSVDSIPVLSGFQSSLFTNTFVHAPPLIHFALTNMVVFGGFSFFVAELRPWVFVVCASFVCLGLLRSFRLLVCPVVRCKRAALRRQVAAFTGPCPCLTSWFRQCCVAYFAGS